MMMKTRSFLVKLYVRAINNRPYGFLVLVIVFAIVFYPCLLQAKANDEQNQIILLNDSAAALEDSNPGLSKSLTQLADEKEKEWKHKDSENRPPWQEQSKLLKAAALAIGPTYPLIAQGLNKMAKEMDAAMGIKK